MDEPITLRTYLTIKAVEASGGKFDMALEAVASTAIEHPEWDLMERRPYAEWEHEKKEKA